MSAPESPVNLAVVAAPDQPDVTPALERLYRAIAVVGDTRVIVDSSKAPSTAFVLRAMPVLDLRLVHLIRDSRGVAYSWNKKVVRPDTPGRTVYMHRSKVGTFDVVELNPPSALLLGTATLLLLAGFLWGSQR